MNFMVSVKNIEAFHAKFILFQEQGIYFSLGGFTRLDARGILNKLYLCTMVL